jgi:uncharacterized 2Fe-2S/4Fe-4S cluster protein (DUF4445 family)
MNEKHRVVFTPSGLSGEVVDGTTVLGAARQLGVDLDSVCGGRGICGRCQVVPSIGTFAKWTITTTGDELNGWSALEQEYCGNRPLAAGHRLGCAAPIRGDAIIDVPAASQVHRQVVRKELRDLDLPQLAVDPLFALRYVEVAAAQLGSGLSAADLVIAAVAEQHGDAVDVVAAGALRRVHAAIAGGTATVATRDAQIVAIWPGFVDEAYGIAVDVGSTTIAGHVCALFGGDIVSSGGRMNPQIRFGEDLMSRVSYVMMNPGGDRQLTVTVREAIDELIGELLTAADLGRERILEIVIVGNPIMHHLVLGIDPTPLGSAPFTLATSASVTGSANDLELALPFASFYTGPCIAGHVGADAAAMILAEGPHRSNDIRLVVDIGTNAEIVLGDRHRQLAASSPTGPAFEGAQISCGQRATAGAVEGVRIDAESLDARVKVIGLDPWSDEPGFDVAVAATGVTGLCGSGIIDLLGEMFLAGIIDADGTILGENAARTDRVVADGRTYRYVFYRDARTTLSITQNDVRAVQLAKAALRAGVDLLLEHAGNPAVADIRLAGAFGAHIDPLHALILGLVPDCPLAGVRSVGNAAGAGAVMALLSAAARREMEEAVSDVEKIETAMEPRFQELFVAAMALPHASAPTDHLASVVSIPDRPTPVGAGGRRRRNR